MSDVTNEEIIDDIPAMLAAARREGAEAMREQAAKLSDSAANGHRELAGQTSNVNAVFYWNEEACDFEELSEAIRALPLPGDDRGPNSGRRQRNHGGAR